ncbi:MAG: DUF2490 domain-containing protein [Candidatus Omnitrophica bacterium]|nr:DUF2490 domain-containing protein [Candidatus Omnitrophota bacterium]
MNKIVLTCLLLVGLLTVNYPVLADSNWQYWSGYTFSRAINDNLVFNLKPEARFFYEPCSLYYTQIDIGLDYKVSDWLTVSPYYCHIEEEKRGDLLSESRPHLNATFNFKLFGFKVSDRSRFECRITEAKDSFRYRNKLTFKFSKVSKFKIQPFISEEPFYDLAADKLNKNRIYAGIDFEMIKNFKAGIYYILEASKNSGNWTNSNVLGTTLIYSF